MEPKSRLDGMFTRLRGRLGQILVFVKRNSLSCALVFGTGLVVGQFMSEILLHSRDGQTMRSVGGAPETQPELMFGHWAMILYPGTAIVRRPNSGEPGYEFFVPSTSDLCATSGCFVNWSCRGDFDEQESSSGERLTLFGFEGVEVDDAATRYSMICEGRSDFTINPLVPRQVPEPDSASRSDEILRLLEESIIQNLQRRAADTE